MLTVENAKSFEYYHKHELKQQKTRKGLVDKENYYTKDAQGIWMGKGAEILGFAGMPILNGELEAWSNGFHPKTGQMLFIPQKARGKKPQWKYKDCCFSSVKDYGMLREFDKSDAIDYKSMHTQAVKDTVKEMEENIIQRRSTGGRLEDDAFAVIAVFEHETSRGTGSYLSTVRPDPNFHSHVLFSRYCVDSKKSVRTVYDYALHNNQKFYGARYRTRMAKNLRKVGFNITKRFGDKLVTSNGKIFVNAFGIEGISNDARQFFSKRNSEIDYHAKVSGMTSALSRKFISQKIKRAKEAWVKEDLQQIWTEEAKQLFGIDTAYIESIRTAKPIDISLTKVEHQLVKDAISRKKDKKTGEVTLRLYDMNLNIRCAEYEQFTDIPWKEMKQHLLKSGLIEKVSRYEYKWNFDLKLADKLQSKWQSKASMTKDSSQYRFEKLATETRPDGTRQIKGLLAGFITAQVTSLMLKQWAEPQTAVASFTPPAPQKSRVAVTVPKIDQLAKIKSRKNILACIAKMEGDIGLLRSQLGQPGLSEKQIADLHNSIREAEAGLELMKQKLINHKEEDDLKADSEETKIITKFGIDI